MAITGYTAGIGKGDLGKGFVPAEYVEQIIQDAPSYSAALSLGRHVPMAKGTRIQPVVESFPEGYWVNGEAGLKGTSGMGWSDLSMTAEELAVILPVPEDLIADTDINLFGEVAPRVAEAFGTKIDAAVFGGSTGGAPASWGDGIIRGAHDNLMSVYDEDILSGVVKMGETMAAHGQDITGFVCAPGFDWRLRGLRDSNGTPIYQPNLREDERATLYGRPLVPVANGASALFAASGAPSLIGADWDKVLIGIRQDISMRVLDQAVLSDDSGKVLLNLAQQDCVAVRFTMRVGFAIAAPKRPDGTVGFPAATLTEGVAETSAKASK